MNILITNSVPLNGGDEALLISTILGVNKKFPEAKINVLCNDADNVRKYIKYVDIDWDWEYVKNNSNGSLKEIIINSLRNFFNYFGFPFYSALSTIFALEKEKKVINLYKNADYIISSAGGYINDFYGYNNRMMSYLLALRFGKKVLFFGHSMGPFFIENRANHEVLKYILSKARHIYLREFVSEKHLKEIGYLGENISVSTDIAFVLYAHYKHLFVEKKKFQNKLVVSFREWPYKSKREDIVEKAIYIISHLIMKGYEITFLSTCQGIDCYTDDSLIAKTIKRNLSDEMASKINIDDKKYTLEELIKKYSQYNAYIGMRLHGAILAMIGGTPSFCLGYEEKSIGIYDFLGISEYHSMYYDNSINILNKINYFLENKDHMDIRRLLNRALQYAEKNFEIFK